MTCTILSLIALTCLVALTPHAQDAAASLGAGQPVMDMVTSVLRQLMSLAVEFIRLVLTEVVHAVQALLPGFTAAK
jgi:hypothetical protein